MDTDETKPNEDSSQQQSNSGSNGANNVALCASCDRCRARKTKCDGKRPCGNCAAKYMKKHKLTSIEGIDIAEFECVYSPAKRRGPVPGRSGQIRKAAEAFRNSNVTTAGVTNNAAGPTTVSAGGLGGLSSVLSAAGGNGASNDATAGLFRAGAAAGTSMDEMQLRLMMQQNQERIMALQNQAAVGGAGATGAGNFMDGGLGGANAELQQQLSLFQQVQQQQNRGGAGNDAGQNEEPPARRVKTTEGGPGGTSANGPGGIPKTITDNTHFLDRSDIEGNRLRACYRLSVDELFRLPLTPTDEEYCAQLNIPGMTPSMIPGAHLAALSAARFAEVALGALVNNEVSQGMELCNAVVHCLRECVQEPVQPQYIFEVARAYFLLGVFRAFRGDMARYFKYRRVAMTYLSKFDLNTDDSGTKLLAAISFLDAWAYMMYNADEKKLPAIDDSVPQVDNSSRSNNNAIGKDLDSSKLQPCRVAADPKNQNWIQGAPPVYLNNEAPLPARALDALACAVRTCCDQANGRFALISKESGMEGMGNGDDIPTSAIQTPTTMAVMSNENELCSRNLVLSAFTLLQQHESSAASQYHARNQGQHLVISAMDAFLENSDEDGSMGFTDSQIQSLLSVCNNTIENPFLLHHAGPTYHMVSNAAVLLCHLLNGMHAMKDEGGQLGEMESAMFEEILDTLMAVRKLLTIHRRKLPAKLRCHGIPRPTSLQYGNESSSSGNDGNNSEGGSKPFIDLGETVLCPCRGCQGFVLMACSPCVAAERAKSANSRLELEAAREAEAVSCGELDKELDDLGEEFNLDDDALLGMISKLISS